jgi:hypothetical protein
VQEHVLSCEVCMEAIHKEIGRRLGRRIFEKLGPAHFRKMSKSRKTLAGGRPPKKK